MIKLNFIALLLFVIVLFSCNKKQDEPTPIITKEVKIDNNVYYHKTPYSVNGYVIYTSFNKLVFYAADMTQTVYNYKKVNSKSYTANVPLNTLITVKNTVDGLLNPVDSIITSIYVDNNLVIKSNQLIVNYTVK